MSGFRFDRALTTVFFHPLGQSLGLGRGQLPILMYHSVSEEPEPGLSPYYQVKTSPRMFEQQMGQLAQEGYRTLGLAEVVRQMDRGGAIGSKSVVITFDDGFHDFYTASFPILSQYHFTATVFLPTAFVGEDRRSFKGRECLTWGEVRELGQAGIEFGSHTVNHPKLVELAWPDVGRELRESKDQIEQALGGRAETFAYPYAFPQGNRDFARRLRGLLAETGYTCCATTEVGRVKAGDDPFRLKRLPVNSLDDARFFRAKLEGGYDWLGGPQALVKKLNNRARAAGKKGVQSMEMESSR